jgi:hypothetical protein
VELTNVVGALVPPKLTVEAATKFAPLTVSVKAGAPAMTMIGETVATVGTGFCRMVAGGAVPHPARHKRLTIPRIANPFIRFLRTAISLMMPLEPSRQLKWIIVSKRTTILQVRRSFNRQRVKRFGRRKQQIAHELTPEVAGARSGDPALVIDFSALA